MKPVNLIPARRIIAKQRRRHVRRCVVICSTWAFVVSAVCVAGQGLTPAVAGEGNLAERLERAARDIEANEQLVAAARDELAAAQATLRATRSIADQPDWSALLALMGRATGDDVMLRSFDLQPAPAVPAVAPKGGNNARGPQPAPAPARAAGFVLATGGLAQSQLAVTQFVLRLERIGLFSRVTLLDTSREPFRDGEATSFRVECVIDATPGVTPAVGPTQGDPS
jgi:hypothetical protein